MATEDRSSNSVTKNTMVSIGLLISMVMGFVYAEHRMTTVEIKVANVLEMKNEIVPRKEYESNFNSIQTQLERIENKMDKLASP